MPQSERSKPNMCKPDAVKLQPLDTANNLPISLTIQPSILYFGTPVVLLSTLNPDGSSNLSPMSSAWALGNRVVLGISRGGQAYANLVRHPEIVINLPSDELWQHVERIAPTTGKQPLPAYKQKLGYRFEADKFGCAGLTPLAATTVQPARVAECPLQLEASCLNIHDLTPHEADDDVNEVIVEARVSCVHAHQDIVIPGTQHIDTHAWKPLLYVFRHYFTTGTRLAVNFKDEVATSDEGLVKGNA
ncbi:MAG: flavin reductase family protein [Deinococcota bacterium]